MQVVAINPKGAYMFLHVNKINSPKLVEKYGEYSINFLNYPNQGQASPELVTKAVIKLMRTHPDWRFQIL